jgi:hypothetical protein
MCMSVRELLDIRKNNGRVSKISLVLEKKSFIYFGRNEY